MELEQEMGFTLCLASMEKYYSGSANDGYHYRGMHSIHEVFAESSKLKKVFDLSGNLVLKDVQLDDERHLVQNVNFADAKPDEDQY